MFFDGGGRRIPVHATTCGASSAAARRRAGSASAGGGAGSNDAERRPDTPDALRRRPDPAALQQRGGDNPGSPFSLSQLRQHRPIQLGLAQQLLDPGVLNLERLDPLRPRQCSSRRAGSATGSMSIQRLRDAAARRSCPRLRRACVRRPLLPHRLLRGDSTPLHVVILPFQGYGLPQHMDHYPGLRSAQITLTHHDGTHPGHCRQRPSPLLSVATTTRPVEPEGSQRRPDSATVIPAPTGRGTICNQGSTSPGEQRAH